MNLKKLMPIFLGIAYMMHAASLTSPIKVVTNKASSQFEQLKKSLGWEEQKKKTVKPKLNEDTVSFLSKTPDYKGKPDLQRGFLNRLELTLDINDSQKEKILNMVKQRELRDAQAR